MKRDLLIYFMTFLALFLILFYIKFDYEANYKFKLSNFFTENNDNGLMSFIFIETQVKTTNELKDYSNLVFKEHISLATNSDSTKIVVIYFFDKSDSAKIPDDYLSRLKMKYPKVNNLSNKINYYPNGFVYTSYSSRHKVKNIAKDSLFKTAVFAPKTGVNAKDILKN